MASLIPWCLLSLCVFVHHIRCDVYFHIPRGSNDRLNNAEPNRKNAKRVFDSQVCIDFVGRAVRISCSFSLSPRCHQTMI